MKHVFLCLLLFAVGCTAGRQLLGASDSDTQPSNAELLKQVQALAAKVDQLETKVARYKKASPTGPPEGPKSTESTRKNVASQDVNAGPSTSVTSTIEDNSNLKTPLFGLGYRSNAILSIGAFGELKFGGQEATAWP
jgi:outer membrane murein-binding lipoprotein Lpp